MAYSIVMPRLGWQMEAGAVVEWLKEEGEYVAAGEMLFVVEGDKATQEMEALESGYLHIPPGSPPCGTQVPVGTLLAYLLAPGEAVPAPETNESTWRATAEAERDVAAVDEVPTALGQPGTSSSSRTPAISPRARRVAAELGVDFSSIKGTGRKGRITEDDVRVAAARLTPAPATPISSLAPGIADDLGVVAEQSPAQKREQEAYGPAVRSASAVRGETGTTVGVGDRGASSGQGTAISQTRRTIAERMATAAHVVAPVTLMTEADATELVRLRSQLQVDSGTPTEPVPSFSDLIAKLTAQALQEHPGMNSHFEGDRIVTADTVNIGLAVDTERGLLVPVLRDVQSKTLRQIARESAEILERARLGESDHDELHGGTFTITNLGMYEIDAFTPIVNLPECGILGIGRIVPKQVVVDLAAERVAIRHRVTLSLTFDHRLVDGAPAARFLQRIKELVERPNLWLGNGSVSPGSALGDGPTA
jgi:pyruvate dehydrogenase E2 component (dihydrolipoamide acetyltransferase)